MGLRLFGFKTMKVNNSESDLKTISFKSEMARGMEVVSISKYKLNSITSNCLAGCAPEYLIELCYSVNDIPARRNLRSSSQAQLLVPRYRKERSGRRGFSVSAPQLWNSFPSDIRLLHNEHQLFRKRLKTHYMQQSFLRH